MKPQIRSAMVILCVTLLVSAGSGATYALFVDTEQATGTIQAETKFNGGGSGGGCGSGVVRGGSGAPNVDTFSISLTGKKNRKFRIEATLSDSQNDLKNVSIKVNRTKKNTPEYENTTSISGGTASITDQTGKLKNKEQYCVSLTVYDNEDNSDKEVKQEST